MIWESCEVALSSKCSYTERTKADERSNLHAVSRITSPEPTVPAAQPHEVPVSVPDTIVSKSTQAVSNLEQPPNSVESPVLHTYVGNSPLNATAAKENGAKGYASILVVLEKMLILCWQVLFDCMVLLVFMHAYPTATTARITEAEPSSLVGKEMRSLQMQCTHLPIADQSRHMGEDSNPDTIAGHGLQIPHQYINGIEMHLNELPPSFDVVSSVCLPIRNVGSTSMSVQAYISSYSEDNISKFSVTPSYPLLLGPNGSKSSLVVSYCPSVVCDGNAFHRARLCFSVNNSLKFSVDLVGVRTYVCDDGY